MLRARTVLVTLVAVGLGLGVAMALTARGDKPAGTVVIPAADVRGPAAPVAVSRTAVGMSGCLAAACHGGPAAKALAGDLGPDAWQCSGSVWAAADPHAGAYKVLEGELAISIMAAYAPGKDATSDVRCLACHTNPALAKDELIADKAARVLREQGVSCEACHGNAGAWLQPHTAWSGDRTRFYEPAGMAPLYDLGERAVACAGCHVGAPAGGGLPVRDMNHDMIAAGHPRLNFDFAEYQRRLPKHWQEKDRTRSGTPQRETNEAKVWYVGRVAHAEVACKLLADRAARAQADDPRTPWPEFAEFNCAACHHHLQVPGAGDWRKSAEYLAGRTPGVPPWQTVWPVTHAPGLANPARGASRVKDVVLTMEAPRPAKPAAAGKVAGDAAAQLAALRRSLVALPDAEVAQQAQAFFPTGAPLVPEWDSATQLFYGLAALDYGRGKPDAATVKNYRSGVTAFRAKDWGGVETAFDLIRPK